MKLKKTSNSSRRPPGSYPRAFAHLGAAHSFLFHLTGLEPETDAVSLDHAYAKPWNAHPEASMAESMVTLFMTRGVRTTNGLMVQSLEYGGAKNSACEEAVDVVSVDAPPPAAYDSSRGRSVMKECETGLSFLRDKEIADDDWEDKVNKSGWTSSQNRLFNKVVRELTGDRLARLAIAGSDNEPLQLRLLVDKTAKRFRQILATVQWDKSTCAWLHKIILDYIPTSFLVAYLDILQSLKSKIPTLIDRLLCGNPLPSPNDAKSIPKSPPPTPKSPPHTSPKSPPPSHSLPTGVVDPESLANLLKRPWDPLGGFFVQHRLRKIPANPIILLAPDAPSGLSASHSPKRKKFWHNQLSSLGKIIPISSGVHSSGGSVHAATAAAQQSLENMINAMRAKVRDLREHYAPQERPIVLMGWGVGALVSVHVALVESVSAVICLGFPFLGIGGCRGDVEDPFLDLRTPTLFVLGQQAPLSPLAEIEDMREKIKAETSLVLVGGADDQLRMCRRKKKLEGITQSIVDRCIQDEILDFLLGVFAAPSSHDHLLLAPKTQNNNSNSGVNGHGAAQLSSAAYNPNVKGTAAASSDGQSGQGANKSRKRPNNRGNNPSVTRVASTGDARRETTTATTPAIKSVVDSAFLATPLSASKSAPDIPPSASDTALHWKAGAETGGRDGTSSSSSSTIPNAAAPSSSLSSSSSAISSALAGPPRPTGPFKGDNGAAGKASGSNGSRGKSKSKKQGGSAKKAPRLSIASTAVGNLSVGEASKVYGLASQPGNPTTSLRPTASSTILNPVLTQQFVSGVSNVGTSRHPAPTPVGHHPVQSSNPQKAVHDADVGSKPSPLSTQQHKLMGTLLAASSNFSPQISLGGGNLSSLLNPALAVAAAAASGNTQSMPQHLLAVSSAKQNPSPSLSVLRPQMPRGNPFNVSSPPSFSASPLSSFTRPPSTGHGDPVAPKLPPTVFHSTGNLARVSNNPTRHPAATKRPSILQQGTADGNNAEKELEDLRRQVKVSSSRSFDKVSAQTPRAHAPLTDAAAASASASASPLKTSTVSPTSVVQQKSSSHVVNHTTAAAGASSSSSQSSVAKSSSGSDLQPQQLFRKSVITSAVKQNPSPTSASSLDSRASASDV